MGVRAVDARNKVVFYPVTIVQDAREGMYVTGLPLKVDIITTGQEFVKSGDVVKPVQATSKNDAKPAAETTGAQVMRDFIERILRIPRAVLTIMVILLIGGVFSYLTLPKESFPAIDIPYFYVATSDTGVSPQDVERLISKPIEDKLKDSTTLTISPRPRRWATRRSCSSSMPRRTRTRPSPTSAPSSTASPRCCRPTRRRRRYPDLVLELPLDQRRLVRRRAGSNAGPARQGPEDRAGSRSRRPERHHLGHA